MTILVTGASGYIGRRVALSLLSRERPIRVFCRDARRLDPALRMNPLVDVVVGDVSDPMAARRACADVSAIVHLAAAMSGSPEEFDRSTIEGTRVMLGAATEARVARMVYVSSMSVYDYSDLGEGALVDEGAPLEDPSRGLRNDYARSKRAAEEVVAEHIRARDISVCVVRPGIVYGPGARHPLTAVNSLRHVAGKIFVLVGGGRREVPLVYVDNLVDALLLLLDQESCAGETYNVIDAHPPTEREYLRALQTVTSERMWILPLPAGVLLPIAQAAESYRRIRRRGGMDIIHGLHRVTKRIRFDAGRLQREVGWRSRVEFSDAMHSAFGGFATQG